MNLSDPKELAALLEALLLAAGRPLSLEALSQLFDEPERPELNTFRQALALLQASCVGRGFELREVATGYRLQVRACFSPWVGRLWEERPQRYSRALLETLALIAYRQPITRGEIEDIRGVTVSSQIIKTLQDRDWIRAVGHREVPGRPTLFATTRTFLDDFNLKNLDELPPLSVVREMSEALSPRVQDELPLPEPLVQTQTEAPSFKSLLEELDSMEQGLKTSFEDLPPTTADDANHESATPLVLSKPSKADP